MAAPTRTPNHLRVIAGTFRPDREAPPHVTMPGLATVPPPPDWLSAPAAAEWNRLGAILVGLQLLTEASLGPLAQLCALHAKLQRTWGAGECPSGHLLAQYRALVNDFGLTPIAQMKLPARKAAPRNNPFARNGRDPAEAQ